MASRGELANAIRALAMDAVQAANSGHPGAPMGMADIAEVLWRDYLHHNPANPLWVNRDRFILSNGHGSMLLYALLHLTGYDLPMDELRRFRQLGSRTPGHPEHDYTPGVETTTGPLGQGLANAVGMAIAERVMAARFNRVEFPLIDHWTYVFLGDGCLMEGISHEACSLAGTLKLGKLVGFYDDNGISIDGAVQPWFSEDVPARFRAYGWHVIADVDGHDPQAISAAIAAARAETERPTLICCKTVIGFGAPNKQGTAGVHGAALGAEEVAAARQALGWRHAPFEIPDDIRRAWDAREAGAARERQWQALFMRYREAHPALAAEFERRYAGKLPEDWEARMAELVHALDERAQKLASRKASQAVIDALNGILPELIGGSADLAESNGTLCQSSRPFGPETGDANYIYFGVREFAMAAIANGLALYGGLIPYAATFLVFSDYARNAVRMAALMRRRSLFIFTHDSIGLGEDGPTHQPVEQLSSLRLIPHMHVWRPCDAVETAMAWKAAIERSDGPSCLVLTRQGLAHQARDRAQIDAIARGGYVIHEAEGAALIIIATGSEVAPAVAAAQMLAERGHPARVVSMPCLEVFERQPKSYRDAVLPPTIRRRIAVEAGAPQLWWRWVGGEGAVIGLERFGESAPGEALMAHFGFTSDRIVEAISSYLGR